YADVRSDRLLRGVAERGAQLGQGKRLVEVRSTQSVEELQRVAAHRVAGREDDALGDPRILARELHVHVAPGEVRHPQVADDDVEGTGQGALARVRPVARHLDGGAPAPE